MGFIACLTFFGHSQAVLADGLRCEALFVDPSPLAQMESTEHRLQSANENSKKFWDQYDQDFIQDVQSRMSYGGMRKFFTEAKIKNHSQIKFLESLGFEFPLDQTQAVKVPKLSSIVIALENKMKELIATGRITADQAIWPTMSIRAVDNHFSSDAIEVSELMKFGENFKVSQLMYDNSKHSKTSNLLSEKDFYQLVLKGFMPIGGLKGVNSEGLHDVNEVLHDLGHWGTFFDHPDYLVTWKKLIQERMQKGIVDKSVNELKSLDDQLEFIAKFMAAESLVLPAPGKSKVILDILRVPDYFRRQGQNVTYKQLLEYYSQFSENTLVGMSLAFSKNGYQLFDFYGGASRDLHTAQQFLYDNRRAQFPIEFFLGNFDWVAKNPHQYKAITPEDLASFAWLILGTKDLSLKDWLVTLENPTTTNNRITEFLKVKIQQLN